MNVNTVLKFIFLVKKCKTSVVFAVFQAAKFNIIVLDKNSISWYNSYVEKTLKENNHKKVLIPTVFTAAPKVLEQFNKTEYAKRLKATGVITSYICPLMYMNNPLCKKKPVITSSNKLRTYTSAKYYTSEDILNIITGGAK